MPTTQLKTRVRFGVFELDVRSGELRKSGFKIKLQPQPVQVLLLLLERPGELITREELRQKLWQADIFVDFERSLNKAVVRLRKSLGDSAGLPRYIETLPRLGYRFIAPIQDISGSLTEATAPPSAPEEKEKDLSYIRGHGKKPWPLLRQAEDDSHKVAPTGAPKTKGWRDASLLTKRWPLLLAGAALLAIAVLLLSLDFGGWRERFARRAPQVNIHSIVVLPLQNLSGDPSQEYFVDGITEALTTDLGKIKVLNVISWTSAMHYKGARKSLREIARELKVDAVLEGAVLRSGDQLRITANLIDTATDRHVWSETYHKNLRDVLALQDEVAHRIASQVQIKLLTQEQVRLAGARPVNAEAYEDYLKGRYAWNTWTEESLRTSVAYFEQALRKDPAYAPAWAGLSDAYRLSTYFGFIPQPTGSKKSKEAALKALRLDNTISDAHFSLGAESVSEWSWSVAEKEFQRALVIEPSNAKAHQIYGYLLRAEGRFDSAIAEMKRAQELDPLSPNKQQSLGATLHMAGRYNEALELFRGLPDGEANSARRHQWMAEIYERKGMQKEAMDELLTALRLAGKQALAIAVERKYLSMGYAPAKRALLWGDLLFLEGRAKNATAPPLALDIAADYALLGKNGRAFKWIDEAFRQHEGELMYLKVDDRFENLRPDPRFQTLVHRLGLPP